MESGTVYQRFAPTRTAGRVTFVNISAIGPPHGSRPAVLRFDTTPATKFRHASGSMNQWGNAAMRQCGNGAMEQWSNGAMEQYSVFTSPFLPASVPALRSPFVRAPL